MHCVPSSRRARACACFAAPWLLAACAPAPPQYVLFIDTDLPVPRFADVLRIDVLDAAGHALAAYTAAAPDPASWPLSLGVGAPPGRAALLRVRIFPAAYARGAHGEPDPLHTVDRLVALPPPPAEGPERVAVFLSGECLGVPSSLAAPLQTCAGAPATTPDAVPQVTRDAPPNTAVTLMADAAVAPTRAGTWWRARAVPCAGSAARAGTPPAFDDAEVCVPGGVFFLGDARLEAQPLSGDGDFSVPEHIVQLSPFYLDAYEVTVRRWRAALDAGFRPPPMSVQPYTPPPSLYAGCTLGRDGGSDAEGALPMTCVTWQAAEAFCAFDAGRALPSEAQWEYAAAGRDDERLFVWGDAPVPDCARAVYGRAPLDEAVGLAANGHDCLAVGSGPAPVGTALFDLSRDGVHDLAGSTGEWTSDVPEDFDRGCWAVPGVLRDPHCTTGARAAQRNLRGGAWDSDSGALFVALRVEAIAAGLRCVRSAAP